MPEDPDDKTHPPATNGEPLRHLLLGELLSAAARTHPHLLSTEELLVDLPALPDRIVKKIDQLRARHAWQARERYRAVVQRMLSEGRTDLGPCLDSDRTQAVLWVIWRDAIELYRAIGTEYVSMPVNHAKVLEDLALVIIRDTNALMRHVTGGTWFKSAGGSNKQVRPKSDGSPGNAPPDRPDGRAGSDAEEIRDLLELADLTDDFKQRLLKQNISLPGARKAIIEERAKLSEVAPEIQTRARELPDPYAMDSAWWDKKLAAAIIDATEPIRDELMETALRAREADSTFERSKVTAKATEPEPESQAELTAAVPPQAMVSPSRRRPKRDNRTEETASIVLQCKKDGITNAREICERLANHPPPAGAKWSGKNWPDYLRLNPDKVHPWLSKIKP